MNACPGRLEIALWWVFGALILGGAFAAVL